MTAAFKRVKTRVKGWRALAPEVAEADVVRLLILSLPPDSRVRRANGK
jgi:hypothetical protein